MLQNETFITGWNDLATIVHDTAIDKGWWDDPEPVRRLREMIYDSGPALGANPKVDELLNQLADRNDAEMLALVHSEISEALEGLRHGNPPDDKLPDFNSAEVELADVIIRMMDMSKMRGWRVAEAVVAKMAYNETREHKHGGKKF